MSTVRLQPSARMRPRRVMKQSILIWVDANVEVDHPDTKKALEKLQELVDDVNLVRTPSECIQLLNEIETLKSYVITAGQVGKALVPQISIMDSLKFIFILCGNKSLHEKWTKQWNKVKSVETDINQIYDQIKIIRKQHLNDEISMDVLTNGDDDQSDGKQLPPSFMYSSMLKEVFFDMYFKQRHFDKMIAKLSSNYVGNNYEIGLINEFSSDYRPDRAIWWYTRECFAYTDVNKSLRLLNADMIVDMAPFIVDLHNQIKQLYNEQLNVLEKTPFTVYRGQAMPREVFCKLTKSKNGLLSFNSFLSTSKNRKVSLPFAEDGATQSNHVGVLFVINIDPSIRVVPFAHIREHSYYPKEDEILFGMHSIFKVGEFQPLPGKTNLFEVQLQLTDEDDPKLLKLKKHMVDQCGDSPESRLATILKDMAAYEKVEEIILELLENEMNERDKGLWNHQLGYIVDSEGEYQKAIEYYQKALEIWRTVLSEDDPNIAATYTNIGFAYDNMGKYSEALENYTKAVRIQEKVLQQNHPNLASSHNNIGEVYREMGDYEKALTYHEKSLEIRKKTLPENHPDLATSYNNIGSVYEQMRDYQKALAYHEKSLEIKRKTLPENHPSLATSYNNIGSVYEQMRDYQKALTYHEKSLEIRKKTFSVNHPDLAISYNNIGLVYKSMGDNQTALTYHEKSFEIRKKTLPENHPDLAASYNNIGMVYSQMEDSEKALIYYEKALEIRKKTLPENHPDIAQSCNNIGVLFYNAKKYKQALQYFEEAKRLWMISLSPKHPNLEAVNNCIKDVKGRMN